MIYAFSRHIVVFFFLTETYLLSKFHHNFRSSPALRPPHPGQCASSWRSISATGMASGTSVWQGRSPWCWGRHLLVSLEPPQPGAGPPLEAARPNAWPCAYRHLSEWLRLEPLTVWDTVQWHRVDCLSMALGSCDWFSCQPWSVYICFDSVFYFSPLERSLQGRALWSDSAMLAWCRGSTARSPWVASESPFSLERKCLLRAINLMTLQRKFPKLSVLTWGKGVPTCEKLCAKSSLFEWK